MARQLLSFCLAFPLLALLPANDAGAVELPVRKAGLWEMKVVRARDAEPRREPASERRQRQLEVVIAEEQRQPVAFAEEPAERGDNRRVAVEDAIEPPGGRRLVDDKRTAAAGFTVQRVLTTTSVISTLNQLVIELGDSFNRVAGELECARNNI